MEYGPVWADAPPMGGRDSGLPTSLASLVVRSLPRLLSLHPSSIADITSTAILDEFLIEVHRPRQ